MSARQRVLKKNAVSIHGGLSIRQDPHRCPHRARRQVNRVCNFTGVWKMTWTTLGPSRFAPLSRRLMCGVFSLASPLNGLSSRHGRHGHGIRNQRRIRTRVVRPPCVAHSPPFFAALMVRFLHWTIPPCFLHKPRACASVARTSTEHGFLPP